MKQAQLAYFRGCAILLVLFFSAAVARAQFSQLDHLAAQLEKEVKPLKPHLVAVADFRSLDGMTVPQGHYFAWIISNALQDRAKKKFSVANHKNFDEDLAKLHLPAVLVPGDALQTAAPEIGSDIIVTGSIERSGNSYALHVTAVRLSDGKALETLSQTIVVNEFLDSMVTPFPEDVYNTAKKNYREQASMPACVYCPDPTYNDLGRRERVQGESVFEVLISAQGVAQRLRPIRLLGYGLDEQAFNAIKKWKFKPATSKADGSPIAVIAPIEVTFRLY
jgi:Gram-negative bacterial TonB protein C-terminal